MIPATTPSRHAGQAARPLALLLGLGLSACASVPVPEDVSWLVNGQTTRADVLKRLGEPAQYYQGGYILAYRYDRNETRQLAPVGQAQANLILVFGADRVLLNHARVDLQ